MKKLIAILISLSPLLVIAQSNVRLNNYWDNTYYVNPASLNEQYKGVFSIAARNQWLGFAGAPKTLFATGTTFLNKIRTQFGLKFYADQIGYNTITNVSLSYAYSVVLDREWRLNMGLAGSFQSLTYDQSEVSTMNADDPALYENLLQSYNYNSDVGAELTNDEWRIGFSGQNLFSLLYAENKLQENVNYAYAMYGKRTKNTVNAKLGVCAIQYKNILQVETNLTACFRVDDDPDAFQVGAFYRTKNEMGVIIGCNLTKTFHLAYSYDFNISGISRYSLGSHELMLVYKLDKYPYKPFSY